MTSKLSSHLSAQGNTKNVFWFYWRHNNLLYLLGFDRICVHSLCNLQIYMPLIFLYFSWAYWKCFSYIFLTSVQSVNLCENHEGVMKVRLKYTSWLWCVWNENTLKEFLSFLITKINMSIQKRQARDKDRRWNACVQTWWTEPSFA